MTSRPTDRAWLASWLGVVAASVLFVISLRSAFTLDPLPRVDAPSPVAAFSAGEVEGDARPEGKASTALVSDPFSVDRALPGSRESDSDSPPDSTPPTLAADVRLLGTVVRGSSPFALCQLPSDAPRIVHVGERLGELTLIALDQGRATFRARDGTQVELTLAKPGT